MDNATGGVEIPNPWQPKKNPLSSFGDPGSFTAAGNTQASDYDSIMKQYRDYAQRYSGNNGNSNANPGGSLSYSPIAPSSPLGYQPLSAGNPLSSSPLSAGRSLTTTPLSYGDPLTGSTIKSGSVDRPKDINYNPITAQTSKYSQSQDVTDSLSRLKDLSDTGGYTPQGIQDIRERAISPIRSIYASGKQDLERQRSLSGGYSPNFGAVTASMARDQADRIGAITTNANAQIAQNVAGNRLQAAPEYAGYSARANEDKTSADQRNADIVNQINELNSGRQLDTSKFNTETGLNVDKYNNDTRLATEQGNRDFNFGVQKFNKEGQLDTNKLNQEVQLALDEKNRNTQLGVDEKNRDTQLGIDEKNRDTQLGVNRENINNRTAIDENNRNFNYGVNKDNRDTALGVNKFNIDNLNNNYFKNRSMDQDSILEALKGQQSLYGTTPALTSLFGNQVMQANQARQSDYDLRNRRIGVLTGRG